ncbi:MAG: hypothetical protein ACREFM_00110 [Hypericibacter sp.]
MNSIEILKPGTFVAMSGQKVTFADADLAAAASAYDPALHEAPIVVGHPVHDGPAYGWVKGLKIEGGRLAANPDQVDPAFAELVRKGHFKKVSASFYEPTSPNNPKPGSWYLRHVGFLGAQPPAVRGLKQVSLSEIEAGVVELADGWDTGSIGGMLRGLRDWILARFGQEDADKALPGDAIDYLLQSAGREQQKDMTAPSASFAEPASQPKETRVKTTQEQAAAAAAAAADTTAANPNDEALRTELAESQRRIADLEATNRRADDGRFLDALIDKGRVLPAQRAALVAFMSSLTEQGTVEFAEGDKTVKKAPRDFFREFLSTLPAQVDFAERAGGEHGEPASDAVALAEQIQDVQAAAAAKGRTLSPSEALANIKKGR